MNRFANIFWHYADALLGVHQRLWPIDRNYSRSSQASTMLTYMALLTLLIAGHLSRMNQFGLALILFSPQWVYALPLQFSPPRDSRTRGWLLGKHSFWEYVSHDAHPIFEFRGYGMAAGLALILASALAMHPWFAVPLLIFWAWRSYVRYRILIEPLRFWATAQEEDQ